MTQFEFILEGKDSTTKVLSPHNDQLMEDMVLDLNNFSGTLRIRRMGVSLPLANGNQQTSTGTLVSESIQQNQTPEPRQVPSTSAIEISESEPYSSVPLTRQSWTTTGFETELIPNSSHHIRDGESFLFSNAARDSDQHEKETGTSPLLTASIQSQSVSSNEGSTTEREMSTTTATTASVYNMDGNDAAGSSVVIQPRQRHRMSKRMSMRDLAQLESFGDTQGQTMLHRLCASHSLDIRRIFDLVEQSPYMVKHQDSNGRLPLHILGRNSELINFQEGQQAATKCALLLMDVYPESIVTVDTDGLMPFIYLVLKWVEWTFDQEDHKFKQSSISCSNTKDYGVSAVISKLNRTLNSMHSLAGTKGGNSGHAKYSASQRNVERPMFESLRESLTKSSNHFPPVMIFDEVEWCFQMLSYGMDHLGGKPLDPAKKVRPTLAYKKQREQRDKLAHNIAEIPGILKTILLIESKQTRCFILECSAIRRSLLCSAMIGPWFTSMIRYKKGYSSEVALDFLQTLSRLNIDDYVGGYRKNLPEDQTEFLRAKLEVYKAVEKLGDMFPTLLIAGERATTQAVTTPLICFIMNRQMATPFTFVTGVGECLLHITAMFAFRQRLLQLTTEETIFVHFPWMTLNSVIFWVAMNQLVFKFCEYVALSHISPSNARKVAFARWSIIEILGIVLATWAAIWTKKVNDDEVQRAFLMAIIVCLLWLRILGFLKIVNEQLATFILALRQMVYDIRFFSLVLFVFVLMFGDMFHLVVSNVDSVDCSAVDLDAAMEAYCSPRSIDSYLRTYAIVVGDFDLEEYNDLGSITFLWFCTTFFGTIVMLNVLIAVVTISYANSQQSSVILFRRARAQFLASHSVMELFIRPSQSRLAEKMSTRSLTYMLLICLRWVLLLTFMTTTIWSSFFIFELASFSIREERYAFTAPLIIFSMLLASLMCCAGSFLFSIFIEQVLPKGKVKDFLLNHVEMQTERVMKKVMSNVYGTDPKDTEGGEVVVGRNADVLERIDKLENLLRQTIANQGRQKEEELGAQLDNGQAFPQLQSVDSKSST